MNFFRIVMLAAVSFLGVACNPDKGNIAEAETVPPEQHASTSLPSKSAEEPEMQALEAQVPEGPMHLAEMSATSSKKLEPGFAVIFHNLATVFVESPHNDGLYLVRFDSLGARNGGYTAISYDSEGIHPLITDMYLARGGGLSLNGVVVPGDSFVLKSSGEFKSIDPETGFDMIKQTRED